MEVNSLNATNHNVQSVAPVQSQSSHQTPVEPRSSQRRQMQSIPALKRIQEPEFIGEKQINAMVNRAFNEANRRLAPVKSEVQFSVHEATNNLMVVIRNSETGDIIREIPPERVLDAVAQAWELAGLFVDEAT
ncbi:MAG: flagellar protein FlaG [Defluviitaleaceae bacterium]|nr:flagellar protein FlaG [Defluviitaleaceae bacterium]